MNNLEFRHINIGDLIIQEICTPPDFRGLKKGIIIEISNNISTIEWITDSDYNLFIPKTTSIQNLSLRRMIMSGTVKHYPVVK